MPHYNITPKKKKKRRVFFNEVSLKWSTNSSPSLSFWTDRRSSILWYRPSYNNFWAIWEEIRIAMLLEFIKTKYYAFNNHTVRIFVIVRTRTMWIYVSLVFSFMKIFFMNFFESRKKLYHKIQSHWMADCLLEYVAHECKNLEKCSLILRRSRLKYIFLN